MNKVTLQQHKVLREEGLQHWREFNKTGAQDELNKVHVIADQIQELHTSPISKLRKQVAKVLHTS